MAPRWGNNKGEKMSTFIDKVEEGIAGLREELVRLFGDQSSIHNLTSDLKGHILDAAATHFADARPSEVPEGDKGAELPSDDKKAV
jgi:hypothetical protein